VKPETQQNPKRRASRRYSPRARTFVGRKIRRLAREGYRGTQRVAIALAMARRRGLKVPKRTRRNPNAPGTALSESSMWLQVKRIGKDLQRLSGYMFTNPVAAHGRELVIIAEAALAQLKRGVHENPASLAIVGANPPGRLLGTIVGDVRYHRTIGKHPGYYRHDFKGRSKACIYAMPDGSLRIVGKGR
jgi:hypothetical protein